MQRNDDFSQRAVVHSADEPWVASPMAGVDRRMLDRIGDEVARATTIVRYAPGSKFSSHVHTGGEEFLVLDGVFQDEHGDFPAGSYIRNPPQSSHTPGSEPGCTIFVKLWQFDLADRTHIRVDTNKMRFVPDREGVEVMPLFSDGSEDVMLERWAQGADIVLDAPNGLELLVLDGGFDEGGDTFRADSWLRLPKGASSLAKVGKNGARVWIKRDHLSETPIGPAV
ncbi:cupin domain-containing protein [Roseovarius phycicola]|uniref:Cupin domain-containing protein n=1 Tax=Roseovarius phycicola TaxID=3080976 RepID=A0ABZ2HGA9_9RHOB